MKKTVIVFGSARKQGHTWKIVEMLKDKLQGQVDIFDAYRLKDISPCIDCRFCWKEPRCVINDGMQEIYRKFDEADNIIFASPVYFHSVTGPLKILIDRCQVYWAAHVRGDKKEITKKAVTILVGGAPKFEKQFVSAQHVLECVCKDLGAEIVDKIEFSNSDRDSVENNESVEMKIQEILEKLNDNRN